MNYNNYDDDYNSEEEYEKEKTGKYFKNAFYFVRTILPNASSLVVMANASSLERRANILRLSKLDEVMMQLKHRPRSYRFSEDEKFGHLTGFEVFQSAINLSWKIFPEYSTGLHMLIDYLAEDTSELDLAKLTIETKETLKAIATADSTNPLFKMMVGKQALVILDRCNRQVSFGQSATGFAGTLARQHELFERNRMVSRKVLSDNSLSFEERMKTTEEMMQTTTLNCLLQVAEDRKKHDKDSSHRIFCMNPGCAVVSGNGIRLLCCGKCRSANYCSKECQIAHWKNGHKKVCKAP
jgi:hypothetical protein